MTATNLLMTLFICPLPPPASAESGRMPLSSHHYLAILPCTRLLILLPLRAFMKLLLFLLLLPSPPLRSLVDTRIVVCCPRSAGKSQSSMFAGGLMLVILEYVHQLPLGLSTMHLVARWCHLRDMARAHILILCVRTLFLKVGGSEYALLI